MKKTSTANEKFRQFSNKLYSAIQADENHISHVAEPAISGSYSYADYFRLHFEEGVELIGGRIFRMCPAPSVTHQRWCGLIYVKLYEYLSDKQAEVFITPFDVRLSNITGTDEDILTVVRPDICVVCDPDKLDEQGCLGCPDIMIEILSGGNNWRELIDKYKVYEEAGVKEYWIINPQRRHFFIYTLNSRGRFQSAGANMYTNGVLSTVFPGFKLNLEELLST